MCDITLCVFFVVVFFILSETLLHVFPQVQGAGTKGWKSVTALFHKDDEHQLLESETESPPVPDQ